jgi:hypothetical protein
MRVSFLYLQYEDLPGIRNIHESKCDGQTYIQNVFIFQGHLLPLIFEVSMVANSKAIMVMHMYFCLPRMI